MKENNYLNIIQGVKTNFITRQNQLALLLLYRHIHVIYMQYVLVRT